MWSRLHVRWDNLPHVTSPTWGPPASCKQALKEAWSHQNITVFITLPQFVLTGCFFLPRGPFSFCPFWSNRVRTLFWTKCSKTFQGLSRTHFPFLKHSIQCKKEPWVYVFFSSSTTWVILSWRCFWVCLLLATWESGLDKVSTRMQGLSSIDCNFQEFSSPWLSTTFKVRANPVNIPTNPIISQIWISMTSHFFILFESLLDTTETTTRHKIAYAPNYKSDSSLQKQGVFFSRERELQKSVVVNYVV